MIDFRCQIRVGITVFFWRVALGMMVFFLTGFPVFPAHAEVSTPASASRFINQFEAVCVPQVEQGAIADKSHLIALDEKQIRTLAGSIGSGTPDAIWLNEPEGWYQVQYSLGEPESCRLMSFQVPPDIMSGLWFSVFETRDQWHLFSDLSDEHVLLIGGTALGRSATRQTADHRFVVYAAFVQYQQLSYVSLSYYKTDLTAINDAPQGDQ